jgi:hypothetical protein
MERSSSCSSAEGGWGRSNVGCAAEGLQEVRGLEKIQRTLLELQHAKTLERAKGLRERFGAGQKAGAGGGGGLHQQTGSSRQQGASSSAAAAEDKSGSTASSSSGWSSDEEEDSELERILQGLSMHDHYRALKINTQELRRQCE